MIECKDFFPSNKREMCRDEVMLKVQLVLASLFTAHKEQVSIEMYSCIDIESLPDCSQCRWDVPSHLYMSCFTSARRFLEASYVSGGM